jgi:hypothetical protein
LSKEKTSASPFSCAVMVATYCQRLWGDLVAA